MDKKISDLIPDARNANKGTMRGRGMLEHSLRQYGAGRSVLIDREGRVIAGNKTLEVAGEIGLEDVVVVQTDGTKIVAVQRMDLDLAKDPRARELAFADNRVGEVDLDWDADELLASIGEGLSLEGLFFDWELEQLKDDTKGSPEDEWNGMPEFDQKDLKPVKTIYVHFSDLKDIQTFSELLNQPMTEKTKFVWFPVREKENLKDYVMHDES